MLSLTDFDYQLPKEKIAQSPISPRDHSKLLMLDRKTGEIADRHFFDLSEILDSNDVLVLNNTKVFPARLIAYKTNGKPIEILLEKEVNLTADSITFEVISKPGMKLGETLSLPHSSATATCTKVHEYTRDLTLGLSREELFAYLDTWAKTPIPPYIHWESQDELALREKYQTVYAKHRGAVAAPTAGLHFTDELLNKLRSKGVEIEYITLHVGLGTFLPVKKDDITAHSMHSEWYELDEKTALSLKNAKQAKKRIIAVGTTTVRALESSKLVPQKGFTNIFIYPSYKFLYVDSMITNFHTPKSTLLMLVSAFVSAPNTNSSFINFMSSLVGIAYQHALDHDYRFYSFGDAMWIY